MVGCKRRDKKTHDPVVTKLDSGNCFPMSPTTTLENLTVQYENCSSKNDTHSVDIWFVFDLKLLGSAYFLKFEMSGGTASDRYCNTGTMYDTARSMCLCEIRSATMNSSFVHSQPITNRDWNSTRTVRDQINNKPYYICSTSVVISPAFVKETK